MWSWSPRIPVDPFPKVGGGSHAEDDLMPLLAPSFPELGVVGCTLYLQLFLHFIARVSSSLSQRGLIFPNNLTGHHASTLRPTCSQERRCHMPTCFRTRFLGEDSSSTRNQRCIYPERLQDTNS